MARTRQPEQKVADVQGLISEIGRVSDPRGTKESVPQIELPSAPQIRPALLADMPLLLDMMDDFNAIEAIPQDVVRLEHALRTLIERPELGMVRVLCLDDAAIGYALICFGYDLEYAGRDAFLTELYFRPEWRGRHLGRPVMEALCAQAKALGVHALHLQVRPENSAARALYARSGFEVVPRLVMSRKLDDVLVAEAAARQADRAKSPTQGMPGPTSSAASGQAPGVGSVLAASPASAPPSIVARFSPVEGRPSGGTQEEVGMLEVSPVELASRLGMSWTDHPANPDAGRLQVRLDRGPSAALVAPELRIRPEAPGVYVYSSGPDGSLRDLVVALLDLCELERDAFHLSRPLD